MEREFAAKTVIDFFSSFESGVNTNISPLLLPPNQLASANNISLRGGFANQRPPFQKKTLNFGGSAALQNLVLGGFFQGGGYYRPDFGTESLIAQISGHLILFTESGSSWQVTDISIAGDLNSATTPQVWMWQSERWMIIQDGTGKLPIFYDGTSSRRSYGPSTLLGTTANAFTPPAIGATVTLTLTAPYTGPYNVPVILNSEFYQPVQNPGGYSVILTNINAPNGTIAAGTPVIVNPAYIAYCPNGGSSGGGVGYGIFYNLQISSTSQFPAPTNYPTFDPASKLIVSNVTATGLGSSDPNYNNSNAPMYFEGVNPDGTVQLQFATNINGVATIATNALIQLASSSAPNVIVGNLNSALVVSSIGQSQTVLLTAPYSGQNNQIVFIGSSAFLVSLPPSGPTSTSLTVINISDGTTSSVSAPATLMSVPELPAGRMGAYGMGCNCVCLTDGLSYIIGDVVGGGSGTPANNYRDAVLKVTQNTFLAGGGSFRLPGTGDIITAMIFPPNLDTSLGQGPLQIGTGYSIFSNIVPGTDPSTWETVTSPIQTESLKDNGPLGYYSTVIVNSDVFFRSNIGVSTLVQARREFFDWGNRPISNEVTFYLDQETQTLLPYGSSLSFDNRFRTTVNPQTTANGVVHLGNVSLNFDLITTLRQQSSPAWEGLWSGLNIFQMVSGRVNGSLRSFAFSYNYTSLQMELYEFLSENSGVVGDNGVTPITWDFETPIAFNKNIKPINDLIQLRSGEVYLNDIIGNVKVQVFYRPDFYPCWTEWNTFTVSQADAEANAKNGYRMRIGLGEPAANVFEIGNNRPLRLGYFFQFRFVITGACTFMGIRASAITQPQPLFAPVECKPAPGQEIDCDLQDEFSIYQLQGAAPSAPLPFNGPLPFANQTVYLPNFCAIGNPFFLGSNLPQWITVDTANNQIIGGPGMFRGETQAAANAAAVAGLQSICNNLDIQCGYYNTSQTVPCGDSTTQTVPAGVYFSEISQADANNQAITQATDQCANASCAGTDTRSYIIYGFTPSLFNFSSGEVSSPTDVVWDGSFRYRLTGCYWNVTNSFGSENIQSGGHRMCARITFDNTHNQWGMEIFYNLSGNCFTLWLGIKTKGTDPSGTYVTTGGGPASVYVVPIV